MATYAVCARVPVLGVCVGVCGAIAASQAARRCHLVSPALALGLKKGEERESISNEYRTH